MISRQNKYKYTLLGGALGMLALSAAPTHGQDAGPRAENEPSGFHADAEIDPLAYIFAGNSVHVGLGYRSLRVSLGAFALDLPDFLEPSDGFQTSFHGFGVKVQYFPFSEQSGGFVGVQADLAHNLIQSERSAAAHRERQVSLGLNLGWRFLLGRFYVTPWVLVNYPVGAQDVELDGMTHNAGGLFPMPTLHIGYRFL